MQRIVSGLKEALGKGVERAVGSLGPGRHTLDLSNGRAVAPGIYFLRLTQGGLGAVGRLPVVTTLDELDEPSLIDILTKPRNALVKQYKKLLEMDGVSLKFTDGALRAIAKAAMHRTRIDVRGMSTDLLRFPSRANCRKPGLAFARECGPRTSQRTSPGFACLGKSQ